MLLSPRRLQHLLTTNQTLTNALYDLCDHPEYIDGLREELKKNNIGGRPEDLPLMDSFLKESARLNPADTGKLHP